MDITVERNHDGAYIISAIVKGYLETRRYYGYTKKQAVALFKEEYA